MSRYISNEAQKKGNSNICPNLYYVQEWTLLKGEEYYYYCTATKKSVNSGYVYHSCNCSYHQCSAWNGKIYPCTLKGK